MPDEPVVHTELHGPVALVTLQRPRVLNAMNWELLRELDLSVRTLGADPDVRVICCTGAGDRAFSVGADVKEFATLDANGIRAWIYAGHTLFNAIAAMPKPTIALIHGYALGGGCELALACDLRLASDTAQVGLPETTLGWIPGWGGMRRLAALIGVARAKELIFLGGRLSAAEAHAAGLVNRVYPADSFREQALALAQTIAEREPLAISLAKAALGATDASAEQRAAYEALALSTLAALPDARTAMERFRG